MRRRRTPTPKKAPITANQTLVTADAHEVTRTYRVPKVNEPVSVVASREIGNWAKKCRKFKMPLFSEENWGTGMLGIAVGLAAAAWTGDFPEKSQRDDVLYGFAAFCLLFGFALLTIAGSKRKKEETDLSVLADEMVAARDANQWKETTDKEPTSEEEQEPQE